jgi:glycerophosphoryl diester phosphodiesterase
MTTPLLLGHRGARAFRDIPENTVESFELCLQHGCDGFEFDVRLAGDGQAVICHDPTTGGMKIEKIASRMLALPTLQQVLEKFSSRAFLDIELKVAGLERQTIAELRRYPPQKEFVVSSFLPEVLTAIHALDASIPLGYLCEKRKQLQEWSDFPAEWVIPRCDLVDQSLIRQVHKAGKKIMLWTVNRAVTMQELANWGVDAIISDETELLVSSLRAGSKD